MKQIFLYIFLLISFGLSAQRQLPFYNTAAGTLTQQGAGSGYVDVKINYSDQTGMTTGAGIDSTCVLIFFNTDDSRGYELPVLSVTTPSSSIPVVRVNITGFPALNGAINGQGVIYKKSSSKHFAPFVSNASNSLQQVIQESVLRDLNDALLSGVDVTKYVGSGVPAFVPTTNEPKLAQGLSSPYPFYAYNGSSWVLVGSGGSGAKIDSNGITKIGAWQIANVDSLKSITGKLDGFTIGTANTVLKSFEITSTPTGIFQGSFNSGNLRYNLDMASFPVTNGLAKKAVTNELKLGGTLTEATAIVSDAANTFAITGLQTAAKTDSVVMINAATGVLRKMPIDSISPKEIVKQASAPSDTMKVWENPNISVIAGETVPYIYKNGSWQSAKPLTVSDYGAKGDGVTNDYAAIQKCQTEQSKVIFETGKTYIVNQAIQALSNHVYEFNGSTLKNATWLTNVFEIVSKSNVVVRDATLEGNNNPLSLPITDGTGGVSVNNGLFITNSSNISVYNSISQKNFANGFYAANSSDILFSDCTGQQNFYGLGTSGDFNGYANITNITFERCKSYSNTSQGITVGINGVFSNVKVLNCIVIPKNADGTEMPEANVLMRNGIMVGYNADTYIISNLKYTLITGNYIKNIGAAGIYANYGNSIITNNRIENCGFHGSNYSTPSTVFNGQSLRGGIVMSDPIRVHVAYNEVIRTRDGGTGVGDSTLVGAIKFIHSQTTQYNYKDSSYSYISHNVINGSEGGGIVNHYGNDNTTIDFNTFLNVKGYEVTVYNESLPTNLNKIVKTFVVENKFFTTGKGAIIYQPYSNAPQKLTTRNNEFSALKSNLIAISIQSSAFDSVMFESENDKFYKYHTAYQSGYKIVNNKQLFKFSSGYYKDITRAIFVNNANSADSLLLICNNCKYENIANVNDYSYNPALVMGEKIGKNTNVIGLAEISFNTTYNRPLFGTWVIGDKFTSHSTGKTYMCTTAGKGGSSGTSVWQDASGWSLTGNSGTTGTNFVGNIDSVDLVFKTNNTERAKIAGNGVFSTAKDAVINSVTVGVGAAQSQTGNTVVGYRSLWVNAAGNNNSTLGYQALTSNTTGGSNTVVGSQAMLANTTGYSNSAFGNQALFANTFGQSNSAIGILSLLSNTIGNYNTALGRSSGQFIKTGSKNTIIGYGSTYIKSAVLDSSLNNTLVLGTYDDIRIYSDSTQRTGIGTTTPLAKLHINGDLIVSTTASGASTDSIMTINPSGNVRKRTLSDVIGTTIAMPQLEFKATSAVTTTDIVSITLTCISGTTIPAGTDFSHMHLYFKGLRQIRDVGASIRDFKITSSTSTTVVIDFYTTAITKTIGVDDYFVMDIVK